MLISTRRGKSSTGRDSRKPYGGLEQKRMKHACCELEKRKLDKWGVLGPVDDANLDVSFTERNQVST